MRRRRRRGRQGGAASSESFDLFLDALCNALGVVMFIMLMIVIFTQSSGLATDAQDANASEASVAEANEQARQAEAQLKESLQALAALPPMGDPALREQWKEAQAKAARTAEELRGVGEALVALRNEIGANENAVAQLRVQLAAVDVKVKSLELARTSGAEARQFIRLVRLRPDARTETLQLLCADGRILPAQFTERTQRFAEPTGSGQVVNNDRAAEAVIGQLLAGRDSSKVRVEIAVWPSGFRAFKLIEPHLIQARFDFNPIPVAEGQTIGEEGKFRGVQ